MRYLPLNDDDRRAMLATIGVDTIDDLFADVPPPARAPQFSLPPHASELAVERQLGALAAQNLTASETAFFCGGGAYKHHIPSLVDHIIQRSEFLTSYTPYQPEITQGTLHYLFEFQTQVAELTGMDVANASMYDGSTAAAEAVLMAHRITRRDRAVLSPNLHPHYAAVIENLSAMSGGKLCALPPAPTASAAQICDDLLAAVDAATSCVVVQNPDVFGGVADFTDFAEAVHAKGALLIIVTSEAVAFGGIKSPAAMGADIAVGEGQSLGNALSFGGPYVGLFATRQKYVRQMPGRLVGETRDKAGKRGFVLTLATREQHIRRDKATSNICTNSGLCALAFTIHMTLLGGAGLHKLARLNHARACALADALTGIDGVDMLTRHFFNEFTIALPRAAAPLVEKLAAQKILAGVPASRLYPQGGLDNLLTLAATETVQPDDITRFAKALSAQLKGGDA